MFLTDREFTDQMIRHQIYLDGYKVYQAATFLPVISRLASVLRRALNSLVIERMNELTKKELNNVLSNVNSEQKPILKEYFDGTETAIKNLIEKETEIVGTILAGMGPTDKLSKSFATKLKNTVSKLIAPNTDTLNNIISKVHNVPIGATGEQLKEFLDKFSARVAKGIIDAIRKGYANGSTPAETIREVIGTRALNFRDGFLNRVKNWNKTITNTAIQHASNVTIREATRAIFDQYLWVSVLDERTSDICRSRSGNIYVYGEGPVPPAHPNCRSTIVPLISAKPNMPGYNEWLEEQSSDFKNDIDKPLSLAEFGSKVGRITGE